MAGFLNSSTALTSGSNFTAPWQLTTSYDSIIGTVFADQAGTINIEQSSDGINADVSTSYPITASSGRGFTEPVVAPYFRVRYVNGGSNQGVFRVSANLSAGGTS